MVVKFNNDDKKNTIKRIRLQNKKMSKMYRTMDNYHGTLESTSVSSGGQQQMNAVVDVTAPLEITNFEDKKKILTSSPTTVCLIYANWCGPCQQFKPIYAQYAKDNVSKARFIQENYDLKLTEGVRGVPSLIVYKGERVVERIVGGDIGKLEEILPPL